MINLQNKYDILRHNLNLGEKINANIVKKISNNQAIVNIKGYNVVIKSDQPLIENKTISFLISGFNEKEKIILLKSINTNFSYNSYEKYFGIKNYITNFLLKNNIPANYLTFDIANYLYLKENEINLEKFLFIYKNYQALSDISLLFKFYKYNLSPDELSIMLSFFNALIKKNNKNIKEKTNYSDSNKSEKIIIDDNKVIIKNNFKKVFNFQKLLNDLLQNNNIEEYLLILYTLIVNSTDEQGYLFKFKTDNDEHNIKLNINSFNDIIIFKFKLEIRNNEIINKFIWFLKEKKAILMINIKNHKIRDLFKKKLIELQFSLEQILKIKIEFFLTENEYKYDSFVNFEVYG